MKIHRFASQTFALVLALVFLFSSCEENPNSRRLPRNSGAPGEVMVVMEDDLWFGPQGDSLRSLFEAYVPLLPQAEPRFSLLHFRLDQMSDLLKHHRNIIEVEISPNVGPENDGLKLTRDKWSAQQLVFTAKTVNSQDFYKLVDNQFSKMLSIIDNTEIARLQKNFQVNHNQKIRALVNEKFGVDMLIPNETELAKEKNNFLWIKRERSKYKGNTAHEVVQGFIVFRYPYKGEQSLSEAAILAARDSVLKKHVPGPDPGTYMTTEYRFAPSSEVVTLNDRYTVLTRGLWRTENYFMGGPFTSLTTTSTDGNWVVSISGFVFAPNFQKREYLREIDAVLQGATFVKDGAPSVATTD
jgi:hypothetical protein